MERADVTAGFFIDEKPVLDLLNLDPVNEPTKPAEEDERTILEISKIPQAIRTGRNCTLCLEERTDSCSTECGHLFCWNCIVGWGREKVNLFVISGWHLLSIFTGRMSAMPPVVKSFSTSPDIQFIEDALIGGTEWDATVFVNYTLSYTCWMRVMLSPFKSIRPVYLIGNVTTKDTWVHTKLSLRFCIFQVDFCSIINYKVHEFVESLSKLFRPTSKVGGIRGTYNYTALNPYINVVIQPDRNFCALYEISLPGKWIQNWPHHLLEIFEDDVLNPGGQEENK